MSIDIYESIAVKMGVFQDELLDLFNQDAQTESARVVYFNLIEDLLPKIYNSQICVHHNISVKELRAHLEKRKDYIQRIDDCKQYIATMTNRLNQFNRLNG